MSASRRTAGALLATAAGLLGACGEEEGPLPQASAERGRALIEQNGCGTCHTIGGIPRANGEVGPALTDFREKRLIAGRLANTPQNVVRWILEPRRIAPETVMPDLGLTPDQARAIAEYLYTQ